MEQSTILETLTRYGDMDDDAIPLADTALFLAGLTHVGRGLSSYRHHLETLARDVEKHHANQCADGIDDTPTTRAASIAHVLYKTHGYHGDTQTYNDLRNADMIEVIDRRKGLPITLAILVIETGRALGWTVQGVNFPGHFLVRFDRGGERLLCDPFDACTPLNASDLRALLKRSLGEKAELSASFYQEASNRDILLRLQNNIKFRQIETEHYSEALETVGIMRRIAPHEHRLLLDDGVLKARLDKTAEAIQSIRDYLRAVTNPHDKYDAEILLRTLEDRM